MSPSEDWDNNVIPAPNLNTNDLYPSFLNIKNPFIFNYEGAKFLGKYKDTNHDTGYIAARQVNKAIKEGYDGVIYRNIYDMFLADSYGVFNPNQIKSATDNTGAFSSTNDDIYDSQT